MTFGNALYIVLIRLLRGTPLVLAGAVSALQPFVVSWLVVNPVAVSQPDALLLALFGISFAVAVVLWTEGTRMVPAAEAGLLGSAETPHAASEPLDGSHRHLRRGPGEHAHTKVRTPGQALAIGALHGLAGTGAVVLLLIAALPTQLEAAAALLVFAPMSVVSMALCTSVFAWLLTRPVLQPIYRSVLIPAFGVFGVLFGTAYMGVL